MQVRQSFRGSDRARRVQTSPGPRTRVAARCAGGRPARDRVESRPRTGIDCTHPRIAHCPEPDRARTGAGTAARGGGGGAVSRVAPGPRNDSKHKTADPHATAPPALGAYGARRRRRSAHPRTRAPPHGATHAHARHAVARRATAAVTTPPRPHRALRDRTHVPAPGYRVRRRYCRLRPTLLQGTRTAPRAA